MCGTCTDTVARNYYYVLVRNGLTGHFVGYWLKCKGVCFRWLAKACKDCKRAFNAMCGPTPTTWVPKVVNTVLSHSALSKRNGYVVAHGETWDQKWGRGHQKREEREVWLRRSHQRMTHHESVCFRWESWEIMFQERLCSTGIIQCSTAIDIKLVKYNSVWVMHSPIWWEYIKVARFLMQKRAPHQGPVQLNSKPPSSGVCDLKVSTLPGCWLCILLRGIQYSKVLLRYRSTSDYLCKVKGTFLREE